MQQIVITNPATSPELAMLARRFTARDTVEKVLTSAIAIYQKRNWPLPDRYYTFVEGDEITVVVFPVEATK